MTNAMAQGMSYGWIELAALLADGKMVRGHYVRGEDLDAILAWRKCFNNTDLFSSVAFYAEPNNSAASILPVFFDIDCRDNLAGTRESAITLCQLLMDRMPVPQDSLDIFFSGNKGFHILVPCEVFEAFYSPVVLGLYKRMAERAEQAGARYIDKSVYTRRRILRCSNSRHRKTGLYKIPLTYEELRDTTMEGILRIAHEPRPENTFAIPRFCQKAAEWYSQAIKSFKRSTRHSGEVRINREFGRGWRMPPCVKAIERAIIPDGIRHKLYVSLARYYGYLNMHFEEIQERLETIDGRHPVRDPDSIERAAAFGYSHPGFPGCNDSVLSMYCSRENCFYARLNLGKVIAHANKSVNIPGRSSAKLGEGGEKPS